MGAGRAFKGPLTTQRRTLLSYRDTGGVYTVHLSCSASRDNTARNAAAYWRITWGSSSAKHTIEIDVVSHARLSVAAESVRVETFIRDWSSGDYVSPVYEMNASIEAGHTEPTELTWTTGPVFFDFNTEYPVPPGAKTISCTPLVCIDDDGASRASDQIPPSYVAIVNTSRRPPTPAHICRTYYYLPDIVFNPRPLPPYTLVAGLEQGVFPDTVLETCGWARMTYWGVPVNAYFYIIFGVKC